MRHTGAATTARRRHAHTHKRQRPCGSRRVSAAPHPARRPPTPAAQPAQGATAAGRLARTQARGRCTPRRGPASMTALAMLPSDPSHGLTHAPAAPQHRRRVAKALVGHRGGVDGEETRERAAGSVRATEGHRVLGTGAHTGGFARKMFWAARQRSLFALRACLYARVRTLYVCVCA